MPSFILLEDFRTSQEHADRWMFDHQQQHNRIAQKLGLPFYNLYPFYPDKDLQWLQDHQQAHNDFNARFNLNSSDLQNIELQDDKSFTRWKYDNWQEHLAIDKVLGF